jgi:imidazolonepropionase-like amidohydrolase
VQPAELDDPVDPRTGARPYLEAHPTRRAELQRCAWHREELDRALHAAGAIYLAASAAPAFGIMPGWGLHEELALLQRIGLTPREALAAATSNYADLFGWNDIGRIEPGRTANLVFLSRDPRQDISAVDAISAVWLRGVAVDRRGLLPRRTHS